MKKTLLTLLTLFTLSTTIVAQNVADLVGTYKGDLYISLGEEISEETKALNDQSIKIEAGKEKGINFALYNFAFGPMALGNIVLNNVGVHADGNIVKFADEAPVDLSFLEGAITANAKINAETSKIEGNNIYVNLDVIWTNDPSGPSPIYVRFIGTKDTATGIEAVEATKEQTIYTLNGIRLSQSFDQLPKGIYIVNGKKIIK